MSKAEATRSDILRQALELIYKQGYQSTSIDDILASTHVTKGAFYYHFRNKEEMGIAMIDEAMQEEIWPHIVSALSSSNNVRDNLYAMMSGLLIKHPFLTVENGCPAVNLIQEMAPLNNAFRDALSRSIDKWEKAIVAEIKRGQKLGQLSSSNDAKQVAVHIITLYHGVRNMGKLLGKTYYASFLKDYRKYLNSLV